MYYLEVIWQQAHDACKGLQLEAGGEGTVRGDQIADTENAVHQRKFWKLQYCSAHLLYADG